VSPTDKGSTIILTAWQNLYFKKHTAVLGLSGITPQIWQLDFKPLLCKIREDQNQSIVIELKKEIQVGSNMTGTDFFYNHNCSSI
jgi:hypothetical protein